MAGLRVFRASGALLAAAAFVAAIPSEAPAIQAGRPAVHTWLVDFESEIPFGAKAEHGAISRVEDGSAAVGTGCLRYRLSAKPGRRSYFLLPLPPGVGISRRGKLSAWIKTQGTFGPVRLRWFALGRDNWVLFQRRFELKNDAEWTRVEWDIFRWRWGNGHVGDWSEVKAIALRVESEVEHIWLDELRLQGPRRRRGPRAEATGEQWLRRIAFGDREPRTVASNDFAVCTDAVAELVEADLKRVMDQMKRARTWVRRVFGNAVGPVADSSVPRLLIFRRERDYRAFFRRLGRQWDCSIVPPKGGGYTVQDISAAPYDPRYGADNPVFLHEAVHALAARELRLPTGTAKHSWLHEGLANYLQLCVYPQSMNWRAYARNFRTPMGEGTFFRPLREICGRRVERKHYSQLAGLVAFLIAERPVWLREIARGLARDRELDEILADLGTSLSELEELWFAWGKSTLVTDAGIAAGPRAQFPRPPEWAEPVPGLGRPAMTTAPVGRPPIPAVRVPVTARQPR